MMKHDFDVAVSFAGEDREFVEEVVALVKASGFNVFYDEYFKHESWGEDLTEYFPRIYEERSRFVVMFISKAYATKQWTRLERRSVLAKAMNEEATYLLPVRLDSTKLPGVRDSIAYLDGLREKPGGIARAIAFKLGQPRTSGGRSFNGRAPRTSAEAAILLGERPPGWEYILFSYHLSTFMEELAPQYDDYRLKFALPDEYVRNADLLQFISREQARILVIVTTFEELLLGPAQSEAMGEPGQAGDPRLIEHLAGRVIRLYEELLNWTNGLRSLATESPEGRGVALALAEYASQPIEAMRTFVDDLRDFADALSPRLESGEEVKLAMMIAFDISERESGRFESALAAFKEVSSR